MYPSLPKCKDFPAAISQMAQIPRFFPRFFDDLSGTALAPAFGMSRCFRYLHIALAAGFVFCSAAAAQAASLTLAWDASVDAAGYVVYYGNQSGVYTGSLDAGRQTLIDVPGLADGAAYYFVVRAYDAFGTLSAPSIEVSRRVGVPYSVQGDFNKDYKADVGIFRPSTGKWYLRGIAELTFGGAGDVPVTRDYDGDGRNDVAVFRPSTGTWYVLRSSTGTTMQASWGGPGDTPVAGDWDGDGKADVAVFRPSTGNWFILQSSNSIGAMYTWGGAGDIPVPADYDGDGRLDVAIFRPSTGDWFVIQSNTGVGSQFVWGTTGDIPVPTDFDGDGKSDVAVFRPSTGAWHVRYTSTSSAAAFSWGGVGDVPVPADFDGDGRCDVAVYRPSDGNWYVLGSSGGPTQSAWGTSGDVPVVK